MDVKTGLISSGDFENCFRSIMEQNEDVLYFFPQQKYQWYL